MSNVHGRPKHPLDRIRQARAWTQRDVAAIIARRTGLNMASQRQKVWRWENAGVTPELAAQHALAAELGLPEHVIERLPWPAWLELVDGVEPIDAPWTEPHARQALADVAETAEMDRRGFLIFSGEKLAASAAAAGLAKRPAQRQSAGHQIVRALNSRVEQLWHLDDQLGGGACLPAAAADLRLVDGVLAKGSFNNDYTIHQQLFDVAAAVGRFAGFAAFDSGKQSAAQRYWQAAMRSAAAAGDELQVAYILSNLALQDIYVNEARFAINLLDAARSTVDKSQRTVLAMLDCWAARAHAARGETKQAATALNRAEALWESRRCEDEPSWIYWMPRPSLTAEAATAMLDMGQPAIAEQMLTEGMRGLAEDSTRDNNLYLVRLSQAQLAMGRLDEAVHSAEQAIHAASDIESQRVSQRVSVMLDELPADEPRVMALRTRSQTA